MLTLSKMVFPRCNESLCTTKNVGDIIEGVTTTRRLSHIQLVSRKMSKSEFRIRIRIAKRKLALMRLIME